MAALAEALRPVVAAWMEQLATVPTAGLLLTVEQAGELLHKAPATVTALCRSGRLSATKVGAHWRIRSQDVEAFQAGKRRTPLAEAAPPVHPDDRALVGL